MSEFYKRAIWWSTEDFVSEAERFKGKNWRDFYDESKFEEALNKMIDNHNAEQGISWTEVNLYLEDMCKKENNEINKTKI